jgi:hypothetical protein
MGEDKSLWLIWRRNLVGRCCCYGWVGGRATLYGTEDFACHTPLLGLGLFESWLAILHPLIILDFFFAI